MNIKSKYEGYGKVTVRDFRKYNNPELVGTIDNITDKDLYVSIDDLENYYTEPIHIKPFESIGISDIGMFCSLLDGDFKAITK